LASESRAGRHDRMENNQRGGSRFTVYIWLLLLFLVVHVALKLVPLYMDYTRMKDTMTTKAGVAQVLKDEEILKDLVSKAKELDLPLGPEDFHMYRDEERRMMSISAEWDVEIHFLFGAYARTFHFEPKVDESFMTLVR